MQIALYFLIS